MHVYLRNGEQQRWLIVDLLDGHIPRLSGFSLSHSQITNTLEPAIWYKLMVIDSISIDCQKHVICWNLISTDASSGTRYLMFDDEDQSCYDFDDDFDELYQLAAFLIKVNPMSVLNEKERRDLIDEYERSLLRLLHCYILGKITLHPGDILQVEQAHEMQIRAIYLLEDAMMMHKRIAEQFLNDMRELRESSILPFFSHLIARGGCSREVVDLLNENVVKDLTRVTNEVDVAQKRVDQMKRKVDQEKKEKDHDATGRDFSKALATIRGKRDILVAKMHQLLEWREMLNLKSTKHQIENGPMEPIILRYLELHDKLIAEKKLAKELCDKKIRAVSVRVCIENALKDLRAGLDSVGEEMTSDGQKPTDVVSENGANAEWQTLTERLASILHNKEHPVGQSFLELTSSFIRKCEDIFKTYERLSETSSSTSDLDGFMVINACNLDFSHEIENMKTSVLQHLEMSTEFLMENFQKKSQMFWRKLRLGYEKCLYNEVGEHLLRLYRIVNANAMLSLERRVTMLRDFPVCRLGLQMKQEWWLSLFEPINASSGAPKGLESNDVIYQKDNHQAQNEAETKCQLKSESCFGGDSFYAQNLNSIAGDADQGSCYKNIDLMREKLQVGTAKVLSRSVSNYNPKLFIGKDLVKFNVNAMVEEISSKVGPSREIIPSYKLFGSFKKDGRSRTLEEQGELSRDAFSSFRTMRNRSYSTPNFRSPIPFSNSPDHGYASPTASFIPRDSFKRHFGEVIDHIRKVFDVHSPLNKMQCLTASLRKIAEKVAELRKRQPDGSVEATDTLSHAVSAEELLPLIVLMLLKLKPAEVGKLYVEICYISDLMADFLSSGCHSYALTEFQIGFRVLSQVCEELEIA